jgi:hypothetical protein
MPLPPDVVEKIQQSFDADRSAQAARLRAEPNGGGLQILADTLIERGYGLDYVQHLEVFYSFDPARQLPSRQGLAIPDQPIRAVLVSDDGANVAAVNADPIIIQTLCLPEVFPTRLANLREEWEKHGRKFAKAADVSADALDRGLRVSLVSFDGSPGDGGCKSSSCPGSSIIGEP